MVRLQGCKYGDIYFYIKDARYAGISMQEMNLQVQMRLCGWKLEAEIERCYH